MRSRLEWYHASTTALATLLEAHAGEFVGLVKETACMQASSCGANVPAYGGPNLAMYRPGASSIPSMMTPAISSLSFLESPQRAKQQLAEETIEALSRLKQHTTDITGNGDGSAPGACQTRCMDPTCP
jgi:hypothetical protein